MRTSDFENNDNLHSLGKERPIIYQTFPRILTNTNSTCKKYGTLNDNGCGKILDYSSPRLLKSLKALGINTLWLTGVIEHATKTDFIDFGIKKDNPNVVKGEAGSPYAIKDYYDINPALAVSVLDRMKEFENTVKAIHKEKLKIIIDFVPNHTAREYHSDAAPDGIEDFGSRDDKGMFFSPSNNYYYIPNQKFSPSFSLKESGEEYIEFPSKATGNDCFTAFCGITDWYETVKLNYGKDYGDGSEHYYPIPDTWHKMLDILKFWASKGVDGFRCDMVFMVPLPFWNWIIKEIKREYPHLIFIGEIYDVNLYRPFLEYGGFDYLYDKVNLYDTLVGIERWNFSAARLTDCWKRVDGIGGQMLNFLENHDEVRFASEEFAGSAVKTLPYLVVSALISSGPYMIYYGQELGESAIDDEGFSGRNNRSTIFDYWSYDSCRRWYDDGKCSLRHLNKHERWLREMYSKVLNLCNEERAFRNGGFYDLMYVNLQNPDFNPHITFAFLRYDNQYAYLIVANFGKEKINPSIIIPEHAIEFCGLQEGNIVSKDLLTSEEICLEILRDRTTTVSVSGWGARILRLPLKKIDKK